MGKRKGTGALAATSGNCVSDNVRQEVTTESPGNPLMVFSSLLEAGIVLFCIAYSLFCLDAWILNAVQIKLSAVSLSLVLGAELLLLGSAVYKKMQLAIHLKRSLYAFLVFLLSLLISLHISPTLEPISWSADYPHHYILIDFLSANEQLPLLTTPGLGEMVQYPFGPSLFTAFIARIFSLSLMTATGTLAAVMSGLLVVIVFLLGRELLGRYSDNASMADAAALVSAFMVFSVPKYFLDQYCGNFYYSMIFGELLVLVSLLALMRVETGNRSWMMVFILAVIGIIFSYTLFVLIPVSALVLFALANPEKIRTFMNTPTLGFGLLAGLIFLLFSYERWDTGTRILQYEGLTVAPDLLNFNPVFLVLVISGILLCIRYVPGYLRSALFLFYLILVAEFFAFGILNQFGIIAGYYTAKIFYLLILLVSVSAGIPVVWFSQYIRKDRIRPAVIIAIIGLLGIFSLYMAVTFPVHEKPIVTNADVTFSRNVEVYLQEHDVPYQNLSITEGQLRGYWFGLLLHMPKGYAGEHFLRNITPFDDWLKDPEARYILGEVTNTTWPEFFEMKGVRLQIVVQDGQKVLIRKTD